MTLQLWTDGSAGPTNPGPGGWSVTTETELVVKGHETNTTNIRMEGRAIIAAMRHADGEYVAIRTDSQLWVNILSQWAVGWERRNWIKSNGQPVMNLDLVQEALAYYRARPVQLQWVRGHNGNRGNTCADYWANRAREEGMQQNPVIAAPVQKRNCF
jgi:ribonuclease HI